MLTDVEWSNIRTYKSGSNWEPFQFYMDVLNESTSLDLLLGYFSSSAISVLSLGFAKFLSTGGTVRIIINDVLSLDDKQILKKISEGYIYQIPFKINNFDQLKLQLDSYNTHFFQCLGWLIQNNRIDIKIIRPLNKKGISHYKCGVFSDGQNKVGFSGSCNFTAFGFLENLERIDTYLSWDDIRSDQWIINQTNDFQEIFNGDATYVQYLNVDEIKTAIATSFGNTDIDQLLIQERDLIEGKKRLYDNKTINKAICLALDKINYLLNAPRFPFQEGPREYQIEAYTAWLTNASQGIFAMATGTGKTLTALYCLLETYKISKQYRAIILVPTIVLVEQWKKECLFFNFRNIIVVSSKEKWNDNLAFFNTASNFSETSYIVIVTYVSFQKDRFQSHFKSFPQNTLIIADEVHNMGSPSMLTLLSKIHLKSRIGLSATPIRKFDLLGNNLLSSFFNDQYPYVFTYSMQQALSNGWLCQYSYFPHIVYLTPIELESYIKISKKLLRFFDSQTGAYLKNKEVEILLLARKRVIHKAINKKTVFNQILNVEFNRRGNLNFSIIYVPEGKDPNYDLHDHFTDDLDDVNLIDEYTRIVSNFNSEIIVKQYTSATKNRKLIISKFESGEINVLTSMKCLDEGVDVPRSELAIFCSSTGNSRQFIQRRGRVLRLHKDKVHAVIHDMIVIPLIEPNENTYQIERNLVSKELERVVDFSNLALNKSETYNELKFILQNYNLNLNDFIN